LTVPVEIIIVNLKAWKFKEDTIGMKKKCIIVWTDFCQGPLPRVGTVHLTNIGYR